MKNCKNCGAEKQKGHKCDYCGTGSKKKKNDIALQLVANIPPVYRDRVYNFIDVKDEYEMYDRYAMIVDVIEKENVNIAEGRQDNE